MQLLKLGQKLSLSEKVFKSKTSSIKAKKSKWHYVYYVLAAFNICTVSVCWYLNHRLSESYNQSVQVNQVWAERLHTYAELGQITGELNAPGNDIFESGNVAQEAQKLQKAFEAFRRHMTNIRHELQSNGSSYNDLLLKNLEDIDISVSDMVAQTELILEDFRTEQATKAARSMAAMDREYQQVSRHLALLRQNVSNVQKQVLEKQKKEATILKQYEMLIAAAILVMVTGIAIYGYQMSRSQEKILNELHKSRSQLQIQTQELQNTLQDLQHTQLQLVQSEKMSSLGQLVAGIAHEVNNPINFIHGNLKHLQTYTKDLLRLLHSYKEEYPQPSPAIQAELEVIDFDFLQEDVSQVLQSMQMGTERIRGIVLSLRNFSRLDEAEYKLVNVHEGIENTLLILDHRLKAKAERPEIQVIKNYTNLPEVECYAGQLNQVFMNILSNAIDALEETNQGRSFQEIQAHPNIIQISTQILDTDKVRITIADNGSGIPEAVLSKLFDPFFTTKPVGKGTGLGLSISYQIITQKHAGKLYCKSTLGEGSQFIIEIPIKQADSMAVAKKSLESIQIKEVQLSQAPLATVAEG